MAPPLPPPQSPLSPVSSDLSPPLQRPPRLVSLLLPLSGEYSVDWTQSNLELDISFLFPHHKHSQAWRPHGHIWYWQVQHLVEARCEECPSQCRLSRKTYLSKHSPAQNWIPEAVGKISDRHFNSIKDIKVQIIFLCSCLIFIADLEIVCYINK